MTDGKSPLLRTAPAAGQPAGLPRFSNGDHAESGTDRATLEPADRRRLPDGLERHALSRRWRRTGTEGHASPHSRSPATPSATCNSASSFEALATRPTPSVMAGVLCSKGCCLIGRSGTSASRAAETPWWVAVPHAYWAQPEGPHSHDPRPPRSSRRAHLVE